MKKLCLILCALVPFFLSAQIFSAISNRSNGVLSTLSNPANMRTDSLFTWDANLFSVGVWGGGSSADMSLKDVAHFGNNFLRENILGIHGLASGGGGIDITGPSIAFKIGKTSSLGIGTRLRMFSNFWNVDGRLISEIGEDKKEPQNYPYSLVPNNNMLMNAAIFSDLAFSYSKILLHDGPNLLKGGVTVKYITGMSQTSIDVQGLTGIVKLHVDSIVPLLTSASGQIITKTSGSLFNNLSNLTSSLVGNGNIGVDIGFVYEYQPENVNRYKFKVGISITDIGKVSYKPDTTYSRSYNVNIPSNNAIFFNNNFNNSSFDHTTEVYDSYPNFFKQTATQSSGYKIGLPTALRIYIDNDLGNGFFTSADINIGLQKKESVTVMYNYNAFALTPRYEKKNFTILVPIIYQSLTHFSAGVSINVGPFYIGSGSLLSSIIGKTKQLDGFMGLRIKPSNKTKNRYTKS